MVTIEQRTQALAESIRVVLEEVKKEYGEEALSKFPFRFWEFLEGKLSWAWMVEVKKLRKEARIKARESNKKLIKKRLSKQTEKLQKKLIRRGLRF
jgi:hypothetical protein